MQTWTFFSENMASDPWKSTPHWTLGTLRLSCTKHSAASSGDLTLFLALESNEPPRYLPCWKTKSMFHIFYVHVNIESVVHRCFFFFSLSFAGVWKSHAIPTVRAADKDYQTRQPTMCKIRTTKSIERAGWELHLPKNLCFFSLYRKFMSVQSY